MPLPTRFVWLLKRSATESSAVLGAALLASAIVVFAGCRNLIDKTWQQIIPLATTIAAYGAANALGGSGFISAFVAGALFGLLAGDEVAKTMQFTEETGTVLDSVTFLVFGAVFWARHSSI